jgi:transcriptional regulator with XRE-family HTH domain
MGLEYSMPRDQWPIGENLRRARGDQNLPLVAVAEKAGISVATLSRVETGKQSLDVGLLITLAAILAVPVAELIGEQNDAGDAQTMTRRLSALPVSERARIFLDASKRQDARGASGMVQDLLSTLDVLREELLKVQNSVSRRARD